MRHLIVVFALVATAVSQARDSSYEEILAQAYGSDGPGAAALVVRRGEVLYRGARGLANLELAVPLTPEHVFRLGSITKQFTGAAIMLLVEEGKVDLDARVQAYLPDYPSHGHDMTVRHLLTHTSGIFNYTSIPGYMSGSGIRADLDTESLIAVFSALEMDFMPGERFSYSNSGYVLAGAIVEAVSGQTYAEFVEARIFAPLGMAHSHYGGRQLIPNRAAGYTVGPDGLANAGFLSMTQPHAAGSLLSTVDDLLSWNSALFEGKLLAMASVKEMIKPARLNDGEESRYGLGLSVADFRGETSVSHGGGIHGFATAARWLPEHEIYTVVLANSDSHEQGPGYVADLLTSVALGRPIDSKPVFLTPAEMLSMTGAYQIAEGDVREIFIADGKLYSQRTGGGRFALRPVGKNKLNYANSFSFVTFKRNRKGEVTHMMFHAEGAEEGQAVPRVGPPDRKLPESTAVSPELYDLWAGVYEISPGFLLTITREDGQLMSQATGQPAVELFPQSATRYFLKVADAQVEFIPGDDGRAAALKLFQGGEERLANRVADPDS